MRKGIVWFFLLVFAEAWSIIQVGHHIGALATLILLTAGLIFGLQLMRSQGINTLVQGAQQLQPNGSPLAPLAIAVVRALAGILLIIPGFISDLFALILLLPFVESAFAGYLTRKSRFQGFATGGFGNSGFNNMFGAGGFTAPGANDSKATGNFYERRGAGRRANDEFARGRVLEHEPNNKS